MSVTLDTVTLVSWPVFWCEPTGEAEWSFRRWRSLDTDDPEAHRHRAIRSIGRRPTRYDESPRHGDRPRCYLASIDPAGWASDDARWPTHCECGEAFVAGDAWHVDQDEVYRAVHSGREWPRADLPIGAMFDACWQPASWRNADGVALTVILPPGGVGDWWNIDGPASHREPDAANPGKERTVLVPHAWSRTGDFRADPPTVSAQPSILTSRYHSFLTAGVLGDPL